MQLPAFTVAAKLLGTYKNDFANGVKWIGEFAKHKINACTMLTG